ncbi:Hypothetical predicted protein [Xyrichtys novacula]|uniref:Prolactin receptor n=1 Tax=Xyrichtys novacula TaxID=13765 RepID=A0AAV1H809_XYRNO|nr:Hypothetical predicted protein [Xyrichtys novacula]
MAAKTAASALEEAELQHEKSPSLRSHTGVSLPVHTGPCGPRAEVTPPAPWAEAVSGASRREEDKTDGEEEWKQSGVMRNTPVSSQKCRLGKRSASCQNQTLTLFNLLRFQHENLRPPSEGAATSSLSADDGLYEGKSHQVCCHDD